MGSELLYVGIGGFLGANLRYLVTRWSAQVFGNDFPYGTFFVNVTGSFLLAMFLYYVSFKIDVPQNIRLLLGTGFFGAYTTFSTYANESVALFQSGNQTASIINIVINNALCILGVLFGIFLAQRIWAAS